MPATTTSAVSAASSLSRLRFGGVIIVIARGDINTLLAVRFDAERLRILVERHHLHTGSAHARALLEDWDAALKCFVKVMPRDYKLVLSVMASAKADGLSEQETSDRVMEAARG